MTIRKKAWLCGLILGSLASAWVIGNDRQISAAATHTQYLFEALKIYQGEFQSGYHRGPIYPLLLAASFHIGNDVMSSAFWTTQATFLGTILLTIFLAHILYGVRIALISTVFLLASETLFDLTWVFGLRFPFLFFLFSSYVLFLEGCKYRRNWHFRFAGLALGLAILTKESGWFYFFYPMFFLIIRDFRTKEIIRGVVQFYVGAFLVLSVWMLFLVYAEKSLFHLLGEMDPRRNRVEVLWGYFSKWLYIKDMILKGVPATFHYVSSNFMAFPLVVLGVPFILWQAISKKKRSDQILLLLIVPMLPILAAYGLFLDGMRHIVILIPFSCILIGRSIDLLLDSLNARPEWKNRWVPVSISVIVLILGYTEIRKYFKPVNSL